MKKIEENYRLVFARVFYPRLELSAGGHSSGRVIRKAEVDDVHLFPRRLGYEAVFSGAIQVDQSRVGTGVVALAGVAGAMYLLQDRQLKTRKGGALLYSLPPITDLGVANTRLIWLGLILLTISFAAGFVSGMKIDTLKFYTSAAIWAAYSALVFLRQIHTLAPRRTAILSLAAFTFILVTLPVIQHLSIPK